MNGYEALAARWDFEKDLLFVGLAVWFIIGLHIGSFLNVCIWRIPREESIMDPPSHCPECDTRLKSRDLIPIVSFLAAHRRCRYCGSPISWRYLLVELASGILFIALYIRFVFNHGAFFATPEFIFMFIWGSALLVALFVDLDHLIIPDQTVLLGIASGVAHNIWLIAKGSEAAFVKVALPGSNFSLATPSSIAGAALCAGIFWIIAFCSAKAFKKDAMGAGDIKLAAAIGSLIPISQALLSFFIAVVLGSIIGLSLIALKKKGKRDYIPFGPMMVAGAFIAVLVGNEIINAWMRFYGFQD